MSKRRFNFELPSRRRLLRLLIIAVVIIGVGIYVILPVVFGIIVVLPFKESVGDPPAGLQEVTLEARDDVPIAAWYAPSQNGAAIILVHGAGGSRESLRAQSTMLLGEGYGVLALDLRGSGESGGTTNRYGWQGTLDISAAVDYLRAQNDALAIGGWGFSLGGEVLLGAASENPEIAAIVADGATSRSVAEVRALPSERSFARTYMHRAIELTVKVLTGDDPPKPLLDSMIEAEGTAFLLIAGEKEGDEIDYNEYFAEQVAPRAGLWIAPDSPHTGAWSRHREEYTGRVLDFFAAHLLDEPAADAS